MVIRKTDLRSAHFAEIHVCGSNPDTEKLQGGNLVDGNEVSILSDLQGCLANALNRGNTQDWIPAERRETCRQKPSREFPYR